MSDEIRGALGAVNGSVGYVYLVDGEGRIRWAACGNAVEGEREGLNAGVLKLVEGWKRRNGIGSGKGEEEEVGGDGMGTAGRKKD